MPSILAEQHTMAVSNWIQGQAVPSSSTKHIPVTSPHTGETIARVPASTPEELHAAVASASEAQKKWGRVPIKDRVQIMFRFKTVLEDNLDAISRVITKENGKTLDEAKAGLLKGIECVEYATSLPQLAGGEVLQVGRGIECKMIRCPLGVVAGITPFNFPAMIPLWMLPIALSMGNAFILKPSEQTPLTALEIAKCLKQAGLPDGLFSVVHGDKTIVEAMCDHPEIKAIAFVGSSAVAKQVYTRATHQGKRARCMGGAKNHLIVVPDANAELASENICASVTGCAGQRCMAASVLLAVGNIDPVIHKLTEKMSRIIPGKEMGPVISQKAKERIEGYLDRAEKGGAKLLLDGRRTPVQGDSAGYFIGPSLIDHAHPTHEAAQDEIFGPVLTIIRVDTIDEALKIENENPYGNAASIYTSSGYIADYIAERANAGMIGINIGVPVPREPFSFGGWNASRYGDGDITGSSAIDFWSQPKKITSKWDSIHQTNWMS